MVNGLTVVAAGQQTGGRLRDSKLFIPNSNGIDRMDAQGGHRGAHFSHSGIDAVLDVPRIFTEAAC